MPVELMPTKGETLRMWRRRECFSQLEAAKTLGVSGSIYREWEADKRRHDQPRKKLGSLLPHEKCYLLRRRNNKKQREIAEALGVTRLWIIKMEEGSAPAARLCRYWRV